MAVVDWWPSQEGRIADGLTLNCIAEGVIVEGSAVKFGTSTSGQITVAAAAALGDGWGIAIRATAAAGDPVPVLAYGLYKMTRSDTGASTQGKYVVNSTTIYYAVPSAVTSATLPLYVIGGGSSYILGMIMQTDVTTADEAVIFIGKTGP